MSLIYLFALSGLCRSVSLHSVLPGAKHVIVIGLFNTDASLVLDFSKLSCALFVHAVLEVTTHGAITLTNLFKDISLVSLLV